MNPDDAARYLVDRLPEFQPVLAEHVRDYDEVLLHVLMGDLGRFYMEQALRTPELASRYWDAVEALASDGDEDVKNAVGASLVEWFGLGTEDERTALRQCVSTTRPATRRMAAFFYPDL